MKRLALLFTLLFPACSTVDSVDTSNPQGALKVADSYNEAERYEEAILRYQEIRSKFPYSAEAVESQLRIADTQFKREYYYEAAAAYEVFRELNPKHNRKEYVIAQIAKSYYFQVPEAIDRDLSSAREAIRYIDEYQRLYPSGEFQNDLYEKELELVKRLAQKELYIGKFYYKRKEWLSALKRFQDLYKNYSFLDEAKEALYFAVFASRKLEYRDLEKQFLDIMKKKYPDSKEYQKALAGEEDHNGLL